MDTFSSAVLSVFGVAIVVQVLRNRAARQKAARQDSLQRQKPQQPQKPQLPAARLRVPRK